MSQVILISGDLSARRPGRAYWQAHKLFIGVIIPIFASLQGYDAPLNVRQVFSAFLLMVVVIVVLYPTTATGTVRLNVGYQQAITQTAIPGEGPGTLTIKGVTNLYVTFSEVRIHVANEGNDTGWLPLAFGTESSDLVGLTSKSGTIILSPTVPAGEYNAIVVAFSNTTAVVNGTSMQVQSVPKYNVVSYPFTVKAGSEVNLNLKFIADYRAIITNHRVTFEVKPILD